MKRLARVGGVLVGIGAGVVAALWLLKDKITGPAPAPVQPADAPRFRVAPPTAPAAGGDDLTRVKGIGPVYSARLADVGISSFADLAGADPATVAERVDAAETQVAGWISQARDLQAD